MPLKRTLADLGEAVRPHVDELDVEELVEIKPSTANPEADWQSSEAEPLLIDTREDDERRRGYIPASLHIARGVLERDIQKRAFGGMVREADLAKPIICYCGGGLRSLLAAYNLKQMGFTNVASLEGGFDAWAEAGQPVAHSRADR